MLGIDFLNPQRPITVAGQEFMDYQNKNLFKELSSLLEKGIEGVFVDGVYKGRNVRTDKEMLTKLEEVVFNETGINITVHPPGPHTDNMAIDAAFIKPGSILNSRMAEALLTVQDTTIGRAFRRLNTDVLTGWVDTAKARIGGDYSKIKFNLYLGPYIESFVSLKLLERYKMPIHEALAAIVIHELGHVFTGFLLMNNQVIDGIMPTLATKMIIDGNKYGKERVTVVYETLKELGVTERPSAEAIESADGPGLIVMFNKCIETRDIRRTLSLGSSGRSSEIYADLFAIRAGCPKAMVIGMAEVSNFTLFGTMSRIAVSVSILAALLCFPATSVISLGIGAFLGMFRLDNMLNPNDEYDSQYRRLKNVLRDHIIHLNEAKWLDSTTKAKMLKEAKELEKIVEEQKPALEGTAIQRLVGWYFSGSDFKAQEFEHYTDEVLAHNLSLYKNYL